MQFWPWICNKLTDHISWNIFREAVLLIVFCLIRCTVNACYPFLTLNLHKIDLSYQLKYLPRGSVVDSVLSDPLYGERVMLCNFDLEFAQFRQTLQQNWPWSSCTHFSNNAFCYVKWRIRIAPVCCWQRLFIIKNN